MERTLPAGDDFTISRVHPDHGPASGGTTVRISGRDPKWSNIIEIFFGDDEGAKLVPATGLRRLADGDIQCVTPAFVPGPARVTGRTRGGGQTFRRAAYTYTPVPAPAVHDVIPRQGPEGIAVEVRGSGFREGHT